MRRHTLWAYASIGFAALVSPALASDFHYSYVEGGFIDRDEAGRDDAGIRVAASLALTPAANGFVAYSDTGDLEQFTLGGALHGPVQRHLDWTVGLSIESMEAGLADDTGLGLRASLRWQLPEYRLEISPGLRYFDLFDEGNTSLRLQALYQLTPEFQLQGALQEGDDDRLEAGLRYAF